MAILSIAQILRMRGVHCMNPVILVMEMTLHGMEFEYMDEFYYDEDGELRKVE